MYFFSNSPVKWRLTKVVWDGFVSKSARAASYAGPAGCAMAATGSVLAHAMWEKQTAYLSCTTVTDEHELEGWAAGLGGVGHGVGAAVVGMGCDAWGGNAQTARAEGVS